MTSHQEIALTATSLQMLAEQLGQPLFMKNQQLEFTLANSAFCSLVERDSTELLGRTETDIFGGRRATENELNDRQALHSDAPVLCTQYYSTPSGATHQRSTAKLPVCAASGQTTHLLCVVGHSGERVGSAEQREEELERYAAERSQAIKTAQEELLRKERLMVLGQLAAGLAHQIRNPLAAIANAIAIARRQTKESNPRVQEALQIANDEIWEANRIIGDLLDFARIRPPRPTAIDLGELVLSALEAEPLPAGINVECEIPSTSVLVDERQVRDALRNLLRNAREAMSDTGTIRLRGRIVDNQAELTIQDTGEGIAKEYRHLLFEPLVTSKPLGIGLGLPTARALVTSQGGSLECEESREGGACFVMRLPLSPETEER
jgi:signal transduction histidine kinase